MSDSEICGAVFKIQTDELVWTDKLTPDNVDPVTLVCSRWPDHMPADLHSDGVTDWIGE